MSYCLPKNRNNPEYVPVALDLRFVFDSDKTTATVGRVIKYIGNIYRNYSNKSRSETEREYFIVEEFFIAMPTRAAFESEIKLCKAINEHTSGLINDGDIKTVLSEFACAHTFVYQNLERDAKVGDLYDWANVDLYYLIAETDKNIAFTCNYIQAKLIKLMHEDLKFRLIKL